MFGRRNQAHVPLWKDLLPEFGYRPQHRNMTIMFDAACQVVFMPLAGNTVQYYATDLDLRVKLLASQYHGCHGSRCLGTVDTENHREIQEFGQLGRTGITVSVDTVIQPPISFDHGQIRCLGIAGKRFEDGLFLDEESVQVITRLACCQGKPACINIIRTFFERSNCFAALGQRGNNTDR